MPGNRQGRAVFFQEGRRKEHREIQLFVDAKDGYPATLNYVELATVSFSYLCSSVLKLNAAQDRKQIEKMVGKIWCVNKNLYRVSHSSSLSKVAKFDAQQ